MQAPEFLRQQDLLLPEQLEGADIDIVGGGSLGGAILLALCKMGCGIRNRVTVTDFDLCELHNLPTQWFRECHTALGAAKVDALAETVELLCERRIETFRARFTGAEGRSLGPIVVLAVDSLEERARIWENLERRDEVAFLVDARMAAEVVEIHSLVLRKDPHEAYAQSLQADGESFTEPCTHRAIVYTSFGAAAFVASMMRSYVRGLAFPRYVAFDFRNFFIECRP